MGFRFNDFLEQYHAGTLHCKNIVLLGGVRELRPDELDKMKGTLGIYFEDFLKVLSKQEEELIEADLWRFIWQTKATDALKEQFQESKHNLFFVNSTGTTQGTNNRATTASSIEVWLTDYQPAPGSCHANVENPFGVRMKKVLRLGLEKYVAQSRNVSKKFSITWSSPVAQNRNLAVLLDALAKSFYQERMLKTYLIENFTQDGDKDLV